MIVQLVQSNIIHSTVAGPASLTPAFPVASTPGTYLLLVVAVTGQGGRITRPGNGWVICTNNVAIGIGMGFFVWPNNPGGITSVPLILGGQNGGAVAMLFEFSNMHIDPYSQYQTNQGQNGNTVNSPAIGLPDIVTLQTHELVFSAHVFEAAPVSGFFNSPDCMQVVGSDVSSGGNPNAQMVCYWGEGLMGIATRTQTQLGSNTDWRVATLKAECWGGQYIRYIQMGQGMAILPGTHGIIGVI